MYTSIFDRITLNNGYQIPPLAICPDMPDFEELDEWKAGHPGEIPFYDTIKWQLELGYRHFDTGMRYGTEEVLGEFFRNYGIPREELFMTTKVYHTHHGYDMTLRYVEQVLRKTGLDYIDLFLIHCPVTYRGLYAETFKALTDLYQTGVIKAVGVSNFTVQHFYDLQEVTDIVPAVNQREQNPLYLQDNLIAYEKRHHITSMSYGPLGRGRLARDARLKRIAEKHDKSVAQIILRWHLQMGFMAVTRSVNKQRLKENSEVFDFTLDAEDMAFIEALNHGLRNWHNPVRFPGTPFYDPVETIFLDTLGEELKKVSLTKEEKRRAQAKMEDALSAKDIDGTLDYVIYAFTLAVAKYGRRADIPELAKNEARKIAAALAERCAAEGKEENCDDRFNFQ